MTHPPLIANQLRQVVGLAWSLLQQLDEAAARVKPAPDKWSPKEILGHLIDSASNNHHKFVRTLAQPHHDFVGYAQDFWVAAQHYQQAAWPSLLTLWQAYNLHLAWVIEHAAPARLAHTISIAGAGPFRLDFIMADYVEHLKHHLRQILPEAPFRSEFANVYRA
ncbi:MAG: DinB family protein [Bernardetiaceae bacterium]|jgi:hypothetical protein|nr:DinB family protein [Bernardetiaceae bacterium]